MLKSKLQIKKHIIDKIKIVGIADLHLDFFIRSNKIRKMVQIINAEKPDLILLAGDVVDENSSPARREAFITCLRKLNAKMGMCAVTGNHEFMHDEKKTVAFFSNSNITLLEDRVVKIANYFYSNRQRRSNLSKKLLLHHK